MRAIATVAFVLVLLASGLALAAGVGAEPRDQKWVSDTLLFAFAVAAGIGLMRTIDGGAGPGHRRQQ